MWSPLTFFKSDVYRNAVVRFASETGYYALPSPQSLHKFLRQPEKIWAEPGRVTDEYIIHSSCMEPTMDAPYAFRVAATYNQVVILFGKAEEELADLARQSQISQAEADKFFIERYRLRKWECTGILWWNLLDGWPQVSDAVVDYYGTKKLGYSYIKRSQAPICLMFDEPDEDGTLALYGCNDTLEAAEVTFTVRRMPDEAPVMQGNVVLDGDNSVKIGLLHDDPSEKSFYLIQWSANGQSGKNHYVSNMPGIDYRWYMKMLELCDMDKFEGFAEAK